MIYIYSKNQNAAYAAKAEIRKVAGDCDMSSYFNEKQFITIAKAATAEDHIFLLDDIRRINSKADIKRRESGENTNEFVCRVCLEAGWGKEELTEEKLEGLYQESVKMVNKCHVDDDEGVLESIKNICAKHFHFSAEDHQKAVDHVFNKLRGYGVLEELILNPDYTEIMVNSTEEIMVEEKGHIHGTGKAFSNKEDLMNVIRRLAIDGDGKFVDEANPLLDAEIIGKDGEKKRINIVLDCIASNGPIITIRKKAARYMPLDTIVEQPEVREYLIAATRAGYNCFISGGTGSGKTTLLNALAQEVGKDERVIIIEDTPEIEIKDKDNVVYMKTRKPNNEGMGEVSCRTLIRNSLRMRPDRLIVGEVRGVEVLDMLSAMNTGHDGSLSTGHSNTSRDMIIRLETMAISEKDIPMRAIRQQISSAVDLIIHVSRMRDGSRRIVEICEVRGLDNNGEVRVVPLWKFKEERNGGKEVKGRLVRTEEKMENTGKFYTYGLDENDVERLLAAESEVTNEKISKLIKIG